MFGNGDNVGRLSARTWRYGTALDTPRQFQAVMRNPRKDVGLVSEAEVPFDVGEQDVDTR